MREEGEERRRRAMEGRGRRNLLTQRNMTRSALGRRDGEREAGRGEMRDDGRRGEREKKRC